MRNGKAQVVTFVKLAKNVWIMGDKLLSMRFQGLLELNGSDGAVVLLEKRQGWGKGWSEVGFLAGERGPYLNPLA